MGFEVSDEVIEKICEGVKEGNEQRLTFEDKETGEVRRVWIKADHTANQNATDAPDPEMLVVDADLAPDDMRKVVAEALAEMLK